MHVLDTNGAWQQDLLDQAERPGHTRVHIERQWSLWSASAQYFVRPKDPRMVLAYARAFGPRRVWRKIRSRQRETTRNDAWLSVGIGWTGPEPRAQVLFVATGAPRGVERWVVNDHLICPVQNLAMAADLEAQRGSPPRHAVAGSPDRPASVLGVTAADELTALAGWQPEEGTVPELSNETWAAIGSLVAKPPIGWVEASPRPASSNVRERVDRRGPASGAPPYHVFGYGQYAKVNAIANLDQSLHLVGIHEINPLQLGPATIDCGPSLDTSPMPRPGEEITSAVVAGYHHTHVPTAVALMEHGARHVIIEKPIASNREQVAELLAAMERYPETRVHCAFQRSHSPFNARLRKDLGAGPISMAATVYEVPLPERHWYRWPIVGNAVVSNGCHWIDYFLHVNDRPEVIDLGAVALSDQTLLTIELATGASAAISLRHEGAPRLGVRDLIQFWTTDGTATIEDNARYRAERGYGTARARSIHRSRSTEAMYEEFGRRIALDLPGDDPKAIGRSAMAVVELAALVEQARSARSDPSP